MVIPPAIPVKRRRALLSMKRLRAVVELLGLDLTTPEGCSWRWGGFEAYVATLALTASMPRPNAIGDSD